MEDRSVKQIELEIWSDFNDEDGDEPLFTISVSSNFSLSDLNVAISKMTQFVSSVFELRFEPSSESNGYSMNGHSNGVSSNGRRRSNGTIHKKVASVLSEEQLKLLRMHSFHFYLYGKLFVIEPLKRGIVFEERGDYTEALAVYKAAVQRLPSSTEALLYYANCLVLLDEFDEAERCYATALEHNPFSGDICYFYSRLLEYRNKYEEAKSLCDGIMKYVKAKKAAVPAPHHPIHYGCYARLGQKYVALSMGKHTRSKMSVQHKLERLIAEKKQLQETIEEMAARNGTKTATTTTRKKRKKRRRGSQEDSEDEEDGDGDDEEERESATMRRLTELNRNIEALEEQLLAKEAIIRNKEEELDGQRTEINVLRSELDAIKKGTSQSGAKVISQSIINDDDQKLELQQKQRQREAETSRPQVDDEHVDHGHHHEDDEKDMMSEYMPLFNRIDSKKRHFESRRKELLKGLLNADSMKNLTDCSNDNERQSLMKEKLELCAVTCNFTEEGDGEEMSRIENKKDLLLEVLQCMSGNKWSSIELLQQCIETIWTNLFRALPDANMIKTDANDDEMDFRDPSWDHLQLIYELTFHVVTNTHIDKKTMKKHLQGAFLENLIHLFSSADDREPQYVKIIVHAIYGRFMALRKSIRKHLSDYCYRYVYLSTFRDVTSWQGLPEILEIFCSIFQGLNVPVKPDYHVVLRNVIVPLHKAFHLDEFHEQLLQCCTQFVTKDPYSAPVILGGMLRFWPKFSPLKEQLFITEIVHILNVCVRHPTVKQSDPAFATITIAVLQQFVECMTSNHHQVAERSLMVWRDETVRICVDLHREKIWPSIYKALQHNKEKYWLAAIRNINRQIMSDFKRRDPEFFEKIERQQQSMDVARKRESKMTKQESREQRWIRLKQLATSNQEST